MIEQWTYSVMVVEDEPLLLGNIVTKINKTGLPFRIAATAYNGVDALDFIRTDPPDLLITDIQMPRMDGLTLIREASALFPELEILILSGHGDFQYAQEALKYGVREYLLKTPSMEEVSQVLGRIGALLEKKRLRHLEQHLFEVATHRPLSGGSIPWFSTPLKQYDLLYLHIGNLSVRSVTADLIEHYQKIAPEQAVRACVKEQMRNHSWLLVNTPSSFGFYLCVFGGQEENLSLDELGKRLLHELTRLASPFPVNLYILRQAADADLEEAVFALLQHCEETRQPGRSGLCTISKESVSPVPPLADGKTKELVEELFLSSDTGQLHQRTESLQHHWRHGGYSQKLVEAHLLYYMDQLRRHREYLSAVEVDHCEYGLLRLLYTSRSSKDLIPELYRMAKEVLFREDRGESPDIDQVVAAIERYLQENFARSISLDSIAASHHYTLSYLSRAFKQQQGISPLKYAIQLRIQEAKRLIREESGLSFREIGVLVGYPEPNYFSRIFKNATGESLSDYQAKIRPGKQN